MPQKKLLRSRARTVQTFEEKEAGPRAGFHLGFNLYRHVPIWAIQLNIVRHELVEVLVKHRGFRREAVLRVVVSGRSPRLLLQGRGGSVKIKSQGWKTKWTSRGPFSALSTPIFKSKYWGSIFVGKLLTRSTKFTCFCSVQTSIFHQTLSSFWRFQC